MINVMACSQINKIIGENMASGFVYPSEGNVFV